MTTSSGEWREVRSYGYSYSFKWGGIWSYQEFPNHILDEDKLSPSNRGTYVPWCPWVPSMSPSGEPGSGRWSTSECQQRCGGERTSPRSVNEVWKGAAWGVEGRSKRIKGLSNGWWEMGVSIHGVPPNGWFIMENPIKVDDVGVALFQETPKCEKCEKCEKRKSLIRRSCNDWCLVNHTACRMYRHTYVEYMNILWL